ncbi:HD domain-containing protein [Nanoarchaeota archaeon]
MKEEDIVFLRKWFRKYVNSFYGKDTETDWNIDNKDKHTYRVCANMLYLTKQLGLPEDKILLGEAVALFHDVGRFYQLMKYNTYMDADSENHAHLSVKVLEDNKVLERLSDEEKEIIITAVKLHNVYVVPEGVDDDVLFYLKLIRDADKLDIIHVEIEYFKTRGKKKIEAMEMGLPDTPDYSKELVEDVLNNRCATYSKMKTYNDLKLLLLTWADEFFFKPSYARLKKKKYLEEIISFLPDTEDIRKVRAHVLKHIDSKIKEVD